MPPSPDVAPGANAPAGDPAPRVVRRLRVAVANDFELVVAGLSTMLAPFESIEVCDSVLLGEPVDSVVDVVLYDTFGRADLGFDELRRLRQQDKVGAIAIYTSNADARLVRAALDAGAAGVLSKALPAAALVAALVRVAGGEVVVAQSGAVAGDGLAGRDWPGRSMGLTERQAEVVVLLLEGLTNAEIAEVLYVGLDTVKTHLRRAYRVLGVRNRAQAVARLLEDPGFGRFR
ncbi:MAG: response regulator transcription factor [Acidimicrobiia bacterium]|nr:response regulator transcription factor [Acidimicrobiia bacterium]